MGLELEVFEDFVSGSMGCTMLVQIGLGRGRSYEHNTEQMVSSSIVTPYQDTTGQCLCVITAISKSLSRLMTFRKEGPYIFDYITNSDAVKVRIELVEKVIAGHRSFKLGWRFKGVTNQEAVISKWSFINSYMDKKAYAVEIRPLNLEIKIAREKSIRQRVELKYHKSVNELSVAKDRILKLNDRASFLAKFSKIPLSLANSQNVLIWKARADGEVLYLNEKGCLNILKYNMEDLVGLSVFDSMFSDDVEICKKLLKNSGNSEIRRLTKFGKVIKVELHTFPLDDTASSVLLIEFPILKF